MGPECAGGGVSEQARPNAVEVGRRLQESRKAVGLTQAEAAEKLGVARTTVVAIEKGERPARAAELMEFAKLYKRTVNEFVRPSKSGLSITVQLRAVVEPEQSGGLESALAEFQSLCEDYLELESLMNAPLNHRYPPVYSSAYGRPEQIGEDVAVAERQRLGLGDGPLLGLRRLLESDVGLRIFYAELPAKVAGLIACTESFGGCIGINRKHPPERRRLTLAHEYAHFLFDRNVTEVQEVAGYHRSPRGERLADSFARHFLMPSSGLRRRFAEVRESRNGLATVADICRLAEQYKVSLEAMCRRLEELGLIKDGTYDSLRKNGFKVNEARQELGLSSERPPRLELLPERYRFLAAEAYHNERISESELGRFLRVDRVAARIAIEKFSRFSELSETGDEREVEVDLGQAVNQ